MSSGSVNSTSAEGGKTALQWKWVIVGVVVGLVIVGVSYFAVAPTFHSAPIQALVMLSGFIIMGAIVGYFSPGVTLREPTIAGAFVLLIMLGLLSIRGEELADGFERTVLGLLLGVGMSWVGAWVGEKLQGSQGHDEHETRRLFTDLLWKWVIVGVVLGFALNVLLVFAFAPLFKIDLNAAFVLFAVSFVITGFVVGVKSPGVTLKEPALAGFFAVVLDWLFLEYGIELKVPGGYLAFGLILGFFLTLFGAWLGERYQISLEKKAVLG
jgi:hypothetical protein